MITFIPQKIDNIKPNQISCCHLNKNRLPTFPVKHGWNTECKWCTFIFTLIYQDIREWASKALYCMAALMWSHRDKSTLRCYFVQCIVLVNGKEMKIILSRNSSKSSKCIRKVQNQMCSQWNAKALATGSPWVLGNPWWHSFNFQHRANVT